MNIIEQYAISKTGKSSDCEDLIFVNSNFAAVIDGATARNNQLYEGHTAGLTAALIIKDSLETLNETFSLRKVLDTITSGFTGFYNKHGLNANNYEEIIAASCVIYSKYYNQIWMVGDCQCLVEDYVINNPNGIDSFMSNLRSFVNQAEILKGKSIEWMIDNDPGCKFIQNLLVDQFLFQNLNYDKDGAFGYAAFDGRKVNDKSIKIIKLDDSVNEVILASDGYPCLKDTLQKSEEALSMALATDPLCIYENRCVKGVKRDCISYDDRAYLKISL